MFGNNTIGELTSTFQYQYGFVGERMVDELMWITIATGSVRPDPWPIVAASSTYRYC